MVVGPFGSSDQPQYISRSILADALGDAIDDQNSCHVVVHTQSACQDSFVIASWSLSGADSGINEGGTLIL